MEAARWRKPEKERRTVELIDVYDRDGSLTGKIVDKETPLQEGEYRFAVGIWIQDSRGDIFLTKRSMEKSYAPGKWENPAGHVQAGETPEHAVIRELWEETGIQVTEGQLTVLGGSCSWPYLGRDYGVRLEVALKDVKFQQGETCGAKWVDFEEFAQMVKDGEFAPSVTEHMKDYQAAFLRFLGREKAELAL